MCNIAAYVGDRPAAPIIIEMIRRQEGLNGGFFTGLATIDGGNIQWQKRCGDLDHLLKTTDAASLTGNTGIIHSRTPESSSDRWAHPFTSDKNGETEIALVINGSFGVFTEKLPEYPSLARQLMSEGYELDSILPEGGKSKILLPEGYVHACDLMCQLIMRNMDGGADEPTAMAKAFCDMPAEFVCLLLSKKYSDRIFFSRVNAPMYLGYAPHGVYMASSPTAFPEDAGEPILLPPLTSGYITKGGYSLTRFAEDFPGEVMAFDAKIMAESYNDVCRALSEGGKTFTELAKVVRAIVGPGCALTAATVYGILYSLQKEGRLIIDKTEIKGAADELTAPLFNLRLK